MEKLLKRKSVCNNAMASRIPELKRAVSDYLSDETGRITKHSVLSLGAILASAAIASSKLKDVSAQTLHNHAHLSYVPTHSSHSSY